MTRIAHPLPALLALGFLGLGASVTAQTSTSEHGVPDANRNSRAALPEVDLQNRRGFYSGSASRSFGVDLPRFDPALGTLRAVELVFEGQYDLQVYVSSRVVTVGDRTLPSQSDNTFRFTAPGLDATATLPVLLEPIIPAIGKNGYASRSGVVVPKTTVYVDPAQLAHWIGAGTIALGLGVDSRYSGGYEGPYETSTKWVPFFNQHVTLRYHYTPVTDGRVVQDLPGEGHALLTLQRGANGGYTPLPGGPLMDVNYAFGQQLALTRYSHVDVNLPFTFKMPDGTDVNSIRVHADGRLTNPAAGVITRGRRLSSFFNEPTATIAPLWCELDPGRRGTVHFHEFPPGGVSITWVDVPEYAPQIPFPEGNTFQVILGGNGDVFFYYMDVEPLNGALIGVSEGHGIPDPGPVDLSDFPSVEQKVVYQNFIGAMDFAKVIRNARLQTLTKPNIGRGLRAVLSGNYHQSASGFLLLGARTNHPIGRQLGRLLPDDFHLRVDLGTAVVVPVTLGAQTIILIPNLYDLRGAEFGLQGVVYDPVWSQNAMKAGLSPSVAVVVGG